MAASSTPLDPDFGHQPGHGGQADPGLPERREYLLDVAQEERVGPDHQDSLSLQRKAVGVEQVGRPVQGHGRLPGTGPTLDHQDPRERGTDDLILFALNRADDVAHVPGAGLAEGREQGTGATQHHALGEQALPGRAVGGSGLGHRQDGCPGRPRWVDEILVLQAEHGPTPHGQMATSGQALGVEPGGSVERLGHRRPPVHHQWLVVRARHRQTPDVERLTEQRPVFVVPFGKAVDAPEVERLVADVQLLQAGQAGAHHDVALGARLECAALAQIEDALEHLARLTPHALQAVVGAIEKLLLSL